jgi:hypothetical protein
LGIITLTIHLLFVNVVLGGSLVMLINRFMGSEGDSSLHYPGIKKIPPTIALAVNFGVAPLLFVQVIYGHLIYSSSVLMGVYWLMIIPVLIIAYYAAYIHARKYSNDSLSKLALIVSIAIMLYIGYILTNNMTLMLHPEQWKEYFSNPNGTILNNVDATVLPRYLHFVTASIAIGGLFFSIVWKFKKEADEETRKVNIEKGLKIFGIFTGVQIVIGLWFLMALPREVMLGFMGGNLPSTIVLMAGILSGVGALITAFTKKLIPTISMTVITVLLMVISRANLRTLYLKDIFNTGSLELSPQYEVMALFLIIFVIGLALVYYMIKLATTDKVGEEV